MGEYIGLDVSLKEAAVSIQRGGKRIWRGKCLSEPHVIAALIRKHAPAPERVVFETGSLSVWFYHAPTAEGLPAICIDARHAKAELDMAANKTDANDADGLAHLAEVKFFRQVRVKAFESMLSRTLIAARTKLVRATLDVASQIRGLMKTFGLIVPRGIGGKFEANVSSRLADNAALARIILPLLEAWRGLRIQATELGRQLLAEARGSQQCQLLMSIPGVGAITANMNYVRLEPGEENVPHIHPESEDTIFILAGRGTVEDFDNGTILEFHANQAIHVPIGVKHAVKADRGVEVISTGGPCPADFRMLKAVGAWPKDG